MGILVDYQVDRATLDVLASAGIVQIELETGDFYFKETAVCVWDDRGFDEVSLPYLTDALLRFIEAEHLWMKVSPRGVFLSQVVSLEEARIVGEGPTLPEAAADYIKKTRKY